MLITAKLCCLALGPLAVAADWVHVHHERDTTIPTAVEAREAAPVADYGPEVAITALLEPRALPKRPKPKKPTKKPIRKPHKPTKKPIKKTTKKTIKKPPPRTPQRTTQRTTRRTTARTTPSTTRSTTQSRAATTTTAITTTTSSSPLGKKGANVAEKRSSPPKKGKKAKKTKLAMPTTSDQYVNMAYASINKLQNTFYNNYRAGQWGQGWWNSANAYTLLADFRAMDNSPWLQQMLDGTNGVLERSIWKQPLTSIGGLNWDKFFDDDQWWSVGLIKAYDVTGNSSLLTIARQTWQTVQDHAMTPPPPCGGLYNAGVGVPGRGQSVIATLLYVQVTALLAARIPADSDYFIGLSEGQWAWIYANVFQSNYIRGDGQKMVGDSCVNNGAILTYLEGTAINALVALNAATGNSTYLDLASIVAARTLVDRGLNQGGVLHDNCDVGFNCNPDEAQFKGIFMRALRNLFDVMPGAANGQIPSFLQVNANAIWDNARRLNDDDLGQNWAGPFNSVGDITLEMAQHSSATMALVAAAYLPGTNLGS